MTGKTITELSTELAVLEERMNTKQAEYKTDIARLAEDNARRDTEAAKRDTEAARRETRFLITVIGVMALGIAILGFMRP